MYAKRSVIGAIMNEEEKAILARIDMLSAELIRAYQELEIVREQARMEATPEEYYGNHATWVIEDIRRFWHKIDVLREQGALPPLVRHIATDGYRYANGKLSAFSNDEMLDRVYMQERASIDSFGNLVVNGEIVKQHWLQSFEKKQSDE
jgi:hypothetical protein